MGWASTRNQRKGKKIKRAPSKSYTVANQEEEKERSKMRV
jgi:hypothetical protein